MSQSKQPEVIRLDITDVTSPLPEQVKQRWGPYKQRQLSKPEVTLEQIQARLASADQKRQVRLRVNVSELPGSCKHRDVRSRVCTRQHTLLLTLLFRCALLHDDVDCVAGGAALGDDTSSSTHIHSGPLWRT